MNAGKGTLGRTSQIRLKKYKTLNKALRRCTKKDPTSIQKTPKKAKSTVKSDHGVRCERRYKDTALMYVCTRSVSMCEIRYGADAHVISTTLSRMEKTPTFFSSFFLHSVVSETMRGKRDSA